MPVPAVLLEPPPMSTPSLKSEVVVAGTLLLSELREYIRKEKPERPEEATRAGTQVSRSHE